MSVPFRFALIATLVISLPVAAADDPFLSPGQVDLMRLLPPPPASGSPEMQAELAEVLALQASRTPERVAQAVRDQAESVFDMFAVTMGEAFAPERLPLAGHLFGRLGETEDVLATPAKTGFARARPFTGNPAVTPALYPSRSFSYPSGHAARSTLSGIVLAAMVPEQRDAIFTRIRDYAESRVIGGVHYRSDVLGGMRAGTAIAAVLFNDPAFQAEYAPARREVRAALGLVP